MDEHCERYAVWAAFLCHQTFGATEEEYLGKESEFYFHRRELTY